jgi:FkbM family methyltransferase
MRIAINIIKKIIFGFEAITKTQIIIKRKPRVRIKAHPDAVSDGNSMQLYVDLVDKFCNFKPKNIFEIGANYAQDAEFLRKSFKIFEKNVYVFEPHPQIFLEVKKMYNFNSFDIAISNSSGKTILHAIDIDHNEYKNSGISSLRSGLTTNEKNFFDVSVDMIRMKDFIKSKKIKAIDFLKIDVEGMNYDVLEGFGKYLEIVKTIQIEGEYLQYWKGQKLYKDIEKILYKNNFLLVSFVLSSDGVQSDSFWVQKPYLNLPTIK